LQAAPDPSSQWQWQGRGFHCRVDQHHRHRHYHHHHPFTPVAITFSHPIPQIRNTMKLSDVSILLNLMNQNLPTKLIPLLMTPKINNNNNGSRKLIPTD